MNKAFTGKIAKNHFFTSEVTLKYHLIIIKVFNIEFNLFNGSILTILLMLVNPYVNLKEYKYY